MADKTFRGALGDNKLVVGTPGVGEEQIDGTQILGATGKSPTFVDSGITFTDLRGWVLTAPDLMLQSVFATGAGASSGIVDAAASVDDNAGGVKTAGEIVTHINTANIHRAVNDGPASTTTIWSSNKVNQELGGKANSSDLTAHTGNADIHRALNDGVTTSTTLWSSQFTQGKLNDKAELSAYNAHVGNAGIHRELNDSLTTLTNLWSASKLDGLFTTKADASALNAHVGTITGNPHQVQHSDLPDKGVNTHPQIDTHIANNSHLSSDERAGIGSMTTPPSASKPFASIDDIIASSGHTIQDVSTTFPDQPNLKFLGDGVTVADDGPGSATTVTIPGGGTGGEVGEAPLTGLLYSRQSAMWAQSPETPTGGLFLQYNFSDALAAADPGVGNISVNNADLALATQLYVNAMTAGGNSADPAWSTWRSGDFVRIQDNTNGDGKTYILTADPLDNTGWYAMNVSALEGGTPTITNGRPTMALMVPSPANRVPNAGADGYHLAKASAADYDFAWVDPAADVTFENLDANGDVGTGAAQVAQGDHLHTGVYDPAGSAAVVQGALDTHEADFSLHVTADQNDALDAATTANAGNRFATINEVSAGGIGEAPDDSFGYLREGATSSTWVRGSRVWEQVADPGVAAAVGDIWIP